MDQELPTYHVIIPAAGSGTRTGLNAPKQFHTIHGRAILDYTLDVFENDPYCEGIVLALPQDMASTFTPKHSKIINIVAGGATRQSSITNALAAFDNIKDTDLILIHDAARPYLHRDDLAKTLRAFKQDGVRAATLCKRVSDTLLHTSGDRPDRSELYALQTPQIFEYDLIAKAHQQATTNQHTDDSALVTALGESVKLVIADHYNDKITFAQDIAMAEKILPETVTYETRTGQGFDVHAFDDGTSEKPLILCGVNVPHDRALTGHSDADVGLHTITDALLGAIAQGDIGRHFPPSDATFKDIDSAVFLEKARDLVKEADGKIINIDLTLICEAPKITPHAPAMIARVADILQIDQRRVSIKATTTEKLGFTGRKEGIAAQAVATVKVPEYE